MSGPKQGMRYTHLYINRGEPVNDSTKARYRLSLLAEAEFPDSSVEQRRLGIDHKKKLTDFIQREIGVRFRTQKNSRVFESWSLFFEKITLEELLDTLTLIISPHYPNNISDIKRHRIRDHVKRIFQEENLAFTIDDEGGVHPLVDAVFTRSMSAVIAGLEGARHKATLMRVEEIERHLLQEPRNYIAAIRSVFGACENLFKLMYGDPRLDAKSAAERLQAVQQRLYHGHPTMLSSSAKLLAGFKEWINAAHFYRHEEGREEPGQPESEIAILLISEGLSYVRWLAAVDRKSAP